MLTPVIILFSVLGAFLFGFIIFLKKWKSARSVQMTPEDMRNALISKNMGGSSYEENIQRFVKQHGVVYTKEELDFI